MPLVMVTRSNNVGDTLLEKVMKSLPVIVAANLDVPENPLARLTPDDIEIRLQESPFDVRHRDVEVTVFATKFEARLETLQLRSDKMALDLQDVLPEWVTGFIWVCLVPSAFSTF